MVMAHNFNLLDGVATPFGKTVDLAFNYGWVGVQLFFVLSGFLITNILISTRETKNYFHSFYSRRALRIFPLYYASLIIGLILVPYFSGHAVQGAENQIWLWTYLSNWAAPNGYEVAAYPHMWSLAVEEQFYLVWPCVVYFLSRAALLRSCVLIAIAALGTRILLRLLDDNLEAVYQYTICRMDALSLGAAAAILFRRENVRAFLTQRRKQVRLIILVALVAEFVISSGSPRTGLVTQTLGHTMLALIASLIIVDLAVNQNGDRLTRAYSWSPLRRLGAYSYSAYVIHRPVHMLVGLPLIKTLGWTEKAATSWPMELTYFVLATTLTLAFSAASYHLFEMPFLRLKRHFEAGKTAQVA